MEGLELLKIFMECEAAKEITKNVPVVEIYRDLLKPGFNEIGEGIGNIIKLALGPISAAVWGYDTLSEYLDKAIKEYLLKKQVSNEKIIVPEPSVAVPTIGAIMYTWHKEELRKMFINLLGASMNMDTASFVHPAFVEIIKQLSSEDAMFLKEFNGSRKALIDFTFQFKTFGGYSGENNISLKGRNEEEKDVISINNLLRLGILEKILCERDSCEIEFEAVERIVFDECKLSMEEDYEHDFSHEELKNAFTGKYYWLQLTVFGHKFVDICLDD